MTRQRSHRRAAAAGEAGFIIVPVLLLLLLLASLAGSLSVYLSSSARALALYDDRLRAAGLFVASMELVAYDQSSVSRPQRKPRGAFSFRLGNASVQVAYETEAARIDLNLAPKDLIANLFQVLGAQPRDALGYADRIIGWRTAPKEESLDGEASLYQAAGLTYSPKGRAFSSIDELWRVLGLPPAMVERALRFVTVYSGRPDVNVFAAPPEVIASLPGMTPARMQQFLSQRDALSRDNASVVDQLGTADGLASTQAGDVMRLRSTITFDNGRTAAAEIVIQLAGSEEPYKVVNWRDLDETARNGAIR